VARETAECREALAGVPREKGFYISYTHAMWSFVGKKGNQRWLWHAIDHHT
jgi:hypothetical protein